MRLEPMRYKEYTWPHNPETGPGAGLQNAPQ